MDWVSRRLCCRSTARPGCGRDAASGCPRGFTLLELLIAVAVLGLLIVLLDQGVAFGLRASAMQQRAENRYGDLEAVDRAIRQIISQADPGIFPEPPAFRGSTGSISLVTELPAAAAGRRERVEAQLFVSGDHLRLRWTRRRHVIPAGPAPTPQEMILMTGVRGLTIAYFNGTGFASDWSADRLPTLVRVTMSFDDGSRKWPPIEVAPLREALEQ